MANTQTLAITGDATATATALNTGTIAVTLATITDSGTGSFKKITTNSKGLVTGTAAVAQADITGLLGAGSITNTMLANSAVANLSGTNTGDQTITLTGDATGTGTGSFAVTLATVTDSGTGSFKKVTVDTKGRVTGTATVAQADITALLGAGSITNTMLANSAVANLSGTNTGDETAATIKTKLGITTLSGSNTGDQTTITGNAGTATKLAAPVNINGVAFDGSAAITINAVDSTARVASSLLGANSGVATLDASGKLTTAQIPAALVGALQYQGVWNASTNTPALVSSTGTKGQYYKVSVAGTTTIDTISQWNVGDMVVFDGTTWDKIDGLSSEVTSVAGRVGAVTLSTSDISGISSYATLASPTFTGTVSGVTAAMVGLGNVTNVAQLAATQTLAVTGDATASATALSTGTIALTLAASGVTAGTVNNSATAVTPITVDAKGRVTATGTAVTITPAFSSITSKPTTLSGYGITDAATSASLASYATLSGATFTGDVVAPNFNSNSDRTLKDNINKIQSASDIINQLEGVSFNWKDSGNKTFGFIAQEVEEIIPELVGKNDELGTLTVNYQGIIPFLVEALKEQAARIAILEAK